MAEVTAADSSTDSTSESLEYQASHYAGGEKKGIYIDYADELGEHPPDTLKQGMKMRHIQMIALGGAIGTGIFIQSGAVLAITGPGPLLLSYIILSIVVWFVMNILTEMTAFLPVPGVGAQQFITDYLDPSFGFALGYNYYYCFSVFVAAEVVATAIIIQYWNTSVNIGIWITIVLVIILALNMCPVKVYGETEFYFAVIKLIAITGLIILGVVLFFGGGPDHDRLGFRYWKNGNSFKSHMVKGSTGRFLSVWTAIIKAGYSFVTSPELIVASAAEVQNPRKVMPRCANQFVYRLAFFYILGSLIIGVIADSNNPRLTSGTGDVFASPFVLGIQNAGIPILNHIINAVVLTSAASCGNAFLYAASRTLFSLSKKGLAPKLFTKTNKWGVPYLAVLATFSIACLSYLNVSVSSLVVFAWLTNVTTISGFINWIIVGFTYLRWRKGIEAQGLQDRVPYRTRFQPYGTYFVMAFVFLIALTNGYAVFFNFNASGFLASYLSFPIILSLYIGHRIYSYFHLGRKRWLTPHDEFDFSKLEMVEFQESQYIERVPKNRWEKIWFSVF